MPPTPDKSLRLSIEIIFVLLGALVIWLGATQHIFFDRRRISWLLLSIALILWGGLQILSAVAADIYKISMCIRGEWVFT